MASCVSQTTVNLNISVAINLLNQFETLQAICFRPKYSQIKNVNLQVIKPLPVVIAGYNYSPGKSFEIDCSLCGGEAKHGI